MNRDLDPDSLSRTTKATRARILAAAANTFIAKGIKATTVQDILIAANVSRRTYYGYFKNQEDALKALYDEATAELNNGVRDAIDETKTPWDKAAAAINAYLTYLRDDEVLRPMMQAEAVRPDSVLAPYREGTLDQLVGTVENAVSAATGQTIDPLVWRGLLLGTEGMALHLMQSGPMTEAEFQRVRLAATAMFQQVLAGLPHMPKQA